MPNDYFSFKQFTIRQDRCAMKVGTDGVLLGVLAPVLALAENSKRILDIGTGTGLVAIMLAQRTGGGAQISAVEIDSEAAIQARENASETPWEIDVYNNSIQTFVLECQEKFDLIVSNPPFFINSLKAPEKSRNTARHTDTLSFEDLVISAEKLLADKGLFTVIIPYSSESDFIKIASANNLIADTIIRVIPKVGKEAKRSVITFCRGNENVNCNINVTELVIEKEERHCYSDEFKSLTADFYLKH
ncbi:MAG: methyltransferase [Paludibacteraceae bacterium]|nr:methyltransferase [Paludibacteraceae bacterium]